MTSWAALRAASALGRPHLVCAVCRLGLPETESHRHTGESSVKGHEVFEGLTHPSYEERLRKQRVFSLEKRRLGEGNLIHVYRYLMGRCKKRLPLGT